MKYILFLFFLMFNISWNHGQNVIVTATYYEPGINSPWMAGLDYDFGFGKIFSFNIQLAGGISSQVNRASTFGDVFMGELQIGARLYMNKIDTWEGMFLSMVSRIGIYNIPIRSRDDPFTSSSKLIINRGHMFQYGMGIYLGYKWKRNLVTSMEGFPFTLVIEPYLGWNLDSFSPLSAPSGFQQSGRNINRFSVGLTFKIGFYTYKKSKATLAREREEEELKNQNSTNNTAAISDNNKQQSEVFYGKQYISITSKSSRGY
ncbi:MAG: hypothetical protein ACRCWI_06560 [Brevinema sp.]